MTNIHPRATNNNSSLPHNGNPTETRRKAFSLLRTISLAASNFTTTSYQDTAEVPYSIISKAYAEFLGTFIFIFCGTMQANVYDIMQPDGLTHSALTHGFATIVVVATFGHISGGHFNPMISWAAVLCRRLPIFHFPIYVFSQFFGGFAACLLSACLQQHRDFITWIPISKLPFRSNIPQMGYDRVHNTTWMKTIELTTQLAATSSGATNLNQTNFWWEGLISETITTYFLITVVLMVAIDPEEKNPAAPFIIGLMAMADIFATASITGTAMNPVRALSPNIVAEIVLSQDTIPAGFWKYHYIYWVGPFWGSSIAVITYRLLLSRSDRIIR